VPIFDTAIVSIQRILHKRPVYVGGKDHSSHRLVALGWSETQAVLVLYSIAIILGAVAVFGFAINMFLAIQIALLLLVGMIVLGSFLSDAKIYSEPENSKKRPSQLAAIFPFIPHKRRIIEICIDTILIIVAYVSAHMLRYDLKIDSYNWSLIQQALPVVVAIKLIAMLFGGMYSGFWKYLDFDSAKRIVTSLVLASLGSITVLVGVYRFAGFSRSVFIIDFLLLLVLVVGFRVMLRSMRESLFGYKKEGRRVLIVGAGEASHNFLDTVRRDIHSDLNPIGIIDDDPWKKGRKLFGVVVVGGRASIEDFVVENAVEEIVVAIPSVSINQKTAILDICEKTGLPVWQV
jgi:UDP-GlcNAc:undecaprenyl-phosphate GlcNAc-1-phosphate transferase